MPNDGYGQSLLIGVRTAVMTTSINRVEGSPLADASSLRARFENDLRDHVLACLPCDASERAALEKERASDLLIIYFNWMDRLIDATPRTVHISDVLGDNPLRADARYCDAFEEIRAKIQIGEPLTPHLSRGILIGYEAARRGPKKLKRRRDLDLLLADWGVHHLHLSTTITTDRFTERTGPLLLGIFHAADAYLIDIVEHGDWSRQSIMETAVRQWPDAGILYELKGVLGLERSVSDVDRGQLRGAGINVALEIDGKVYMSPCGISSAGTSTNAAMRSIQVRRDIDEFCSAIEGEPSRLAGLFLQQGWLPPKNPELQFVFVSDGYGVLEWRTQTLLRLR
jgi:hypothetical protein